MLSESLIIAALLVGNPPVGTVVNQTGTDKFSIRTPHTVFANTDINESSGMAAMRGGSSGAGPVKLWTHNDSGDSARIFLTDTNGNDLATVKISGAKSIDWEDMASFTAAGKNWLLLADTGANNHKLEVFSIYLVAEPQLPGNFEAPQKLTAKVTSIIEFSWPDGCRCDCEAIAVDTNQRKIYLAQKTFSFGFDLYTIDLPDEIFEDKTRPVAKIKASPEKLGTVRDISCITAMDISADGKKMVFLTYNGAYEFSRRKGQSWQDVFSNATPATPTKISLPPLKQSEAICYGPEGKNLYVSSEKLPAALISILRN